MNETLEGIVINVADYRENDTLIKAVTKEYGLLAFLGRNTKNLNSDKRVFPFNRYLLTADIKKGKTFFNLKERKLLGTLQENDLNTSAYLEIFNEALSKFSDLAGSLYDHLKLVIAKADYLSGCLFFAQLAKLDGIEPYVDGCVICNEKKIIRLDEKAGGFVCIDHSLIKENQDLQRLRKFRLVNKAQIKDYDLLKEAEYDQEDFMLIVDFVLTNSQIDLKSYRWLKRLWDL